MPPRARGSRRIHESRRWRFVTALRWASDRWLNRNSEPHKVAMSGGARVHVGGKARGKMGFGCSLLTGGDKANQSHDDLLPLDSVCPPLCARLSFQVQPVLMSDAIAHADYFDRAWIFGNVSTAQSNMDVIRHLSRCTRWLCGYSCVCMFVCTCVCVWNLCIRRWYVSKHMFVLIVN